MKYLITIIVGLGIFGAIFFNSMNAPLENPLGATVCNVQQGCTGTTTFAQNSFLFGNVINAVGATSSPYFGNFTFTNATGTNATITVINLPNVIASSTLASDVSGNISYIPNGTANQIYGMNTGGTGQSYRTVTAIANETTVAHSATQLAIGIADPLVATKGGTGLASINVGNILFGGSLSTALETDTGFTWDNTNNMLGVASTSPAFVLSVGGNAYFSNFVSASSTFQATSTINNNLVFGTASSTIYHAYLPTANATFGTTTLSGGTITVNTTAIRADSVVFLSNQACTSCGALFVGTRTAGTSFVISSTNVLDASIVGWIILQPF